MKPEKTAKPTARQKLLGLLALFNPGNVVPEQLHPLLRGGGSSMAANAIVALIVYAAIDTEALRQTARMWTMCCLVVVACSLVALIVVRQNFSALAGLRTASWIVTVASGIRGLVWGIGFYLLMPDADNYEQIMLGWMIAGMICGGAFTNWSHPASALAFAALAALGGFLGMSGVPGLSHTWMPFAVLVLLVLLMRLVLVSVSVLRQSVIAEQQVVAKSEVIGLLLRDFEENASDWLWETDSRGLLIRGADRLARLLELSTDRIAKKPMAVIVEIFATEENANAMFFAKLKAFESFSNQIVALNGGGMDRYLKLSAKPFLNAEGVCTGWHGVASDVTDERIADMKVRKLALFDTLTELPNRAFFYDQLDKTIGSKLKTQSWVMYLDLDGFKAVNDTYGHAAGDQLLRSVAARLSSCLPAKGMLARLGGDEFAIICSGPQERIAQYASSIAEATELAFLVNSNDISIGVSIGIAPILDAVTDRDELMRRADVALYAAKHQGRGTARYYDEALDRTQLRRKDIEVGLRKALSLELFKLHYQPIVDMNSGKTQAYEALLRLETPELGHVQPSEFIPIAEDCGLISEIGDWVIQKACKDAARWPNNIGVAVNVSSLQLRSHRILSVVTQALADANLPASRLEIELTESALVENIEHTMKILADLKSLGVRLALDDFGTGYSSLSHLHQFNFDKIKIDRSFVQSFGERRESAAVVNAVAHLARDLGISMTAEGVETAAHMAAMREVGCDEVQGYLLGRPQALPQESVVDVFGHKKA
jgi:diguanylate cyclase (GGDEF)-like protein